MPIRPALKTIHPRVPAPREVRRVLCPHCGASFEVSQRAISIRCTRCTRPLEFKDLTLRDRLEGDLSTMGHVSVAPHGELVGRLTCGRFTNQGHFDGQATVYGNIELAEQSLTTGQIAAKSLRVVRGATLRARASISPKPQITPTIRVIASSVPRHGVVVRR